MNELTYVIAFVSDMKRSVEFYRDVFGLPLKFESPHWTEFANQGSTLALHPARSENPDAPPSETTPAGHCHLGFSVPHLDAFHHEMQSKGVRCVQAPRALDFGGRLAVYADPDGLQISVSEAAKK